MVVTPILIYSMVDCRTQQTFRVFLTKDLKSYITKTDYQSWFEFLPGIKMIESYFLTFNYFG